MQNNYENAANGSNTNPNGNGNQQHLQQQQQQEEEESSALRYSASSLSLEAAAHEAAIADGVINPDPNYNKAGDSKLKKAGLRRGKWTTEEEFYANRLIYEFKLGLLPLTDGTTLRTFLSKLLNCDPMRISKKFVGQNCIGKQVFRRRQQDLEKLTTEQIEKSRRELAELERKFLERVAQTNRTKSSSGGGKGMKDGKIGYEDENGNAIIAPWMLPPAGSDPNQQQQQQQAIQQQQQPQQQQQQQQHGFRGPPSIYGGEHDGNMMMQRQMMMGPRPENMDNINMKAYKEYQNMLAMGQMNNPQMQQGNQRGQNPYQYLQCYQNQYITAGNRDQANGNMPINSGPPPNFRAIQSGDYPKDGPSTADNRFSDSNYQQMNPFPWAVRNAQPDEQQMRMNMPNHNGSNSNANMTSNSISNFGGSDSILGSMSSLFGNNLDSLASLSGLMESGSMPVIRDNQESRKDFSSNAGNDNSGGRSVHSHSTQGCKGIEDEVGYPIDDNPESDKKDKSLGSKRKIDEALSRSEIDKNGIGGKAPTSSARVAPIDSSFDKSMLTASSSMYSEGSAPRSDGRVVIPSVPVHMLRENPKPDKGSAAEMNSLQSKKSSDKKASASDKSSGDQDMPRNSSIDNFWMLVDMGDLPKPDNDVLSETLWANPSGSAPIGVKGRSANGAQPGKYPNMQPASSAYGPWGGAPIILPPVDAREERKMQNSSDSNPLASMALYRNHRESNPALAKSLSEINGRMNSGDSSISSGDPRKIKLENR